MGNICRIKKWRENNNEINFLCLFNLGQFPIQFSSILSFNIFAGTPATIENASMSRVIAELSAAMSFLPIATTDSIGRLAPIQTSSVVFTLFFYFLNQNSSVGLCENMLAGFYRHSMFR